MKNRIIASLLLFVLCLSMVGCAANKGDKNTEIEHTESNDAVQEDTQSTSPSVDTPVVEVPPVETPPVETPPVAAPPVETPPVTPPPVEEPAVPTTFKYLCFLCGDPYGTNKEGRYFDDTYAYTYIVSDYADGQQFTYKEEYKLVSTELLEDGSTGYYIETYYNGYVSERIYITIIDATKATISFSSGMEGGIGDYVIIDSFEGIFNLS